MDREKKTIKFHFQKMKEYSEKKEFFFRRQKIIMLHVLARNKSDSVDL